MTKPRVSRPAKDWTNIDRYWESLARKRTARRKREGQRGPDPNNPRATVGMVPFLAMMAGLAVLVVAFFFAAWPRDHQPRKAAPAQSELGTAPPGWLEPEQGR